MASEFIQPLLVKAVHPYKGKNNDELCFKKGQIITVTQQEDGGWWEGTLNGQTGWFPSNYVKECDGQTSMNSSVCDLSSQFGSPTKILLDVASQQKSNRALVVKDIVSSEEAHVTELQTLLNNFLLPIQRSDLLTREDYQLLTSNIFQVLNAHEMLLRSLQDCNNVSLDCQRVGSVFLSLAPKLKQVHETYCAGHPKAILAMDKYKEDLCRIMEENGAAHPGLLVLTTGLSKPFRRVDKYSGMLQELERHIEENHPDRGDIQRSVCVYKDIASNCMMIRKQKELELEVQRGGIRGWEGEDLSTMGEILSMGSVAIGPDHRDRYLVLFSNTLLILSVSHRMSTFIYEGRLPLAGIEIVKLEDTEMYKNAFQITGPMIETILAICQTKEDQKMWIEKIGRQINASRCSSLVASPPCTPRKISTTSPYHQPSGTQSGTPTSTPVPPPHATLKRKTSKQERDSCKAWSIANLRPSPPMKNHLFMEEKHTKTLLTKSPSIAGSVHSSKVNGDAQHPIVAKVESKSDSTIETLIGLMKQMREEIKEEFRTVYDKIEHLESHVKSQS